MKEMLNSYMKKSRWNSYPCYKDSGIEWLGKIPEHWKILPLKIIASFVSRGNSPEYVEEEGIPIINQACIHWEGLDLGNIKFQKQTDVSNWKGKLKKGDLMINSTGTGTLGRATIFNEKNTYIADSHITIVRFSCPKTNESYYYYLLRTPIYQGYMYAVLVSGATNQVELNREGLRSTEILFPPPAEQIAIASFLDRETGRINTLIKKKEKLIKLLKEKRTALISHAVTKGLDPNVPMKDSGIEWLGKIPEHWFILQLNHVVRKFVDYRGATPKKTLDGIPLITAKNINNGKIDLEISQEFISEKEYEDWMVRGLPKVGDVLITTEAPLGEAAQIPDKKVALAQRIILFKVDENKMKNEYLKYYLVSCSGKGELWSRATGSTALGIKAWKLKEVLVTTPPIDEQKSVVLYLSRKEQEIDSLITRINVIVEKLKEYRSALITAAVTGKIDVRGDAT
jgi:type I restriction enzyme S subunit